MVYREAHANQLKVYIEEARSKRSGRGAMPYQAPQPKPSRSPGNEAKNPHLMESFPPIVMERTWFALAMLGVALLFVGIVSQLGMLDSKIKYMVAGAICFSLWTYFEDRYKTFLARGEVAWLKTLPFEVQGYLESLCQEPSSHEYSVKVTITMKHEPLPQWVLDAIPEIVPREINMSQSVDNPLQFSMYGMKVKTMRAADKDALPSNVPLRDCLHECITQLLLPIDATYRLQRITFFVV
jgi:hypothetical protein